MNNKETSKDGNYYRRRSDIERTQSNIGILSGELELRIAVEATGLGIFDYYPLTGEMHWSDEAKAHFGLSPEAHVNYNVFLVALHREDRERVDRMMHNALQRESEGRYNIEYRTVGVEDGKERWIAARGQAFFNDKDEAVRFIGTTLDITERKRLEDALRVSEEHYRLLFDKSPLPKWVIDLETFAFLQVNNAAVEHYGYSREEFERLTLADIRTPGEVEKFKRWEKEARSAGKKFEGRVQTKHRKRNNEVIDADVLYTEIVYNKRRAALAVIVDITERKRYEEELKRTVKDLERSNRELEQFAYVASHDLQEPLRTVASYVELLALKYKGKLDEKAERYIAYTVDGADRMSSLINDLLAYSRIATRGKQFEPVDVNAVLKFVTVNLKKAIAESKAAVTSDALPVVTGDGTQLVQLFQNLIGNALKFRKKDVPPVIRISAERGEHEWTFGVHDNGIGIEPRFYERIFVIFQRLHTREEYSGTGIGLSICKRIVERHGGRMWVESKPGEGSSFYFTLPAEGSSSVQAEA
jgi:PAS domain S-box-containing protein